MSTVTILLLAAAAGYGIAKYLRLPGVPLLVLAGVALTVFGAIPDEELHYQVLLLGLAFLVFVVGTELNPRRVGRHGKVVLLVGLAQFFTLGAVGLAIALWLGFELVVSLYLALAVTASSTLVVVTLLRQRQQFFEPFGRVTLGVLLLQDVLVIFFISSLSRAGEGLGASMMALGGTVLLFGLAVVFLRWVTPWLLLHLKLDEETVLLTVLSILFIFVGLAYLMGLPPVTGAFLAGFSLSAFPVQGIIRGQLTSLADFFLAVFFVALGAALTIPTARELLLVGLLAMVVLTLTPPLVAWVAQQVGLNTRASIESGLLLAQCSEFSIVVALIGVAQGHIDEGKMAVIVLMTVVTMILTPFVATDRNTWRLMRLVPSSRMEPESSRLHQGHVILIGFGTNARKMAERLQKENQTVVVVDDDPGIVARAREMGLEAVRGDGASGEVLARAGASRARLVISTMRRVADNETLLRRLGGVPVYTLIFDPGDARRLRTLGAVPVLYSEAAAEDFRQWYEEAGPGSDGHRERPAGAQS